MVNNELPSTYKIAFFGYLESETDKMGTMERFGALFNIKHQATLEHLFSDHMVVIKSGISLDVANQYQQAMRDIGTDCSIEPDTALRKFSSTDINYERKKKRLVASVHKKHFSNIAIEPKV